MPRAPPFAPDLVHPSYRSTGIAHHIACVYRPFTHDLINLTWRNQTMHGTQKRNLSMFRRVRELLTTEAANPTIAAPLANLDGVITRMGEHGVAQDSLTRRTRSSTVHIGDRARTLRRDLMRPALLAARTVYPVIGNGATALRTVMRMPKNTRDVEALVVAAQSFANAVDEHSAAFVAAGLPKDFAARLRTAAEQLVALIDTRAREEQGRVAATRGLAAESQRGGALVRLIDALVEPELRAEPARAAEWRKAMRIRSFASGGGAPALPELSTEPRTPTPIATVGTETAKLAA